MDANKYEGTRVGEISHFFDKISVAVIKPESGLNNGDSIRVYDREGNVVIEQQVVSMQVDGEEIQKADVGQEFALKLEGDAKDGYLVYKK